MDKAGLIYCAQGFIQSLSRVLEQQRLTDFSTALDGIETISIQRGPLPRFKHESMQYLEALLAQIRDPAMLTAAKSLDWGQLYEGGAIDSMLAEGMFAAQAAGTYGVFPAQHVATGMFLLAPDVFYPLHTHAAHEVYHCLAGEITIAHRLEEPAFTLCANQSSETPSGRLHSLRTGSTPVLLAYVWTGEITAPTWWWERSEGGNWTRTAWRRKPGESWKVERTEPVTADDFRLAMQ